MKCPTCGNQIVSNANFCGACGKPLRASKASAVRGTPAELPRVNFIGAIKLGFKNYFRFSGRSTRAEYWWWILFITLAGITLSIADSGINEFAAPGQSSWLNTAFNLVTIIPSLALGSRRLHDIGKSGWWQLGIILLVVSGFGLIITGIVFGFILLSGSGDIDGGFGLNFGSAVVICLLLAGLCALLCSIGWWIRWFVRKGDEGQNKYGPDRHIATR